MRHSYLGEHLAQRLLSYLAALFAGIALIFGDGIAGFQIFGFALVIASLGGFMSEFSKVKKNAKKENR